MAEDTYPTLTEGENDSVFVTDLTIAIIEPAPDNVWGDGWKLHATGCNHLNRREVDWSHKVDSLEQAVYTAFGDFIGEGMTYAEATKYLHVCPCAIKQVIV
jgi:hypothetical protein